MSVTYVHNLSVFVIAALAASVAICTPAAAQTTAPADPLKIMDEKIEKQLERKDASQASKDMVKTLWADYKQAFEMARMNEHWLLKAMQNGPDVSGFDEYLGRYTGSESETSTALLEVVQDAKGRVLVKLEGHEIPAICDDLRIVLTTGDLVPAPVPQLGKEKYVTLEYLALTRVGGKYYLQSFSDGGPHGRQLFKLSGAKSAPSGTAPSATTPDATKQPSRNYGTDTLQPGMPTYTIQDAVKNRQYYQAFRQISTGPIEPDNPTAFNKQQFLETVADQGDADWGKIMDDPTIPYDQKTQMIYLILDRRMGHCAVRPGGRGGRGGLGGCFVVGLNQPMTQQQAQSAIQADQADQPAQSAQPAQAQPTQPDQASPAAPTDVDNSMPNLPKGGRTIVTP